MTCGYVCPKCEGRKILDDGSECDWCKEEPKETKVEQGPSNASSITDEEWLKETHEGKCCADG